MPRPRGLAYRARRERTRLAVRGVPGTASRVRSWVIGPDAHLDIFPLWAYVRCMSATLGTTAFWILTSLTEGRRHGYAILRDVDEASGDPGSLKTTTLYATIERLQARGLVSEDGDEIVDGRARRYYVLTDTGRTRLEAEVADLERRASAARRALASRTPAPAIGLATFA